MSRPNNLPDRRKWHLEKTISLGHIISVTVLVAGIGGPVLIWGRAMESRVVALETVNAEAVRFDVKRDGEAREYRIILNGRVDKIEDRLLAIQLSISQLNNRK